MIDLTFTRPIGDVPIVVTECMTIGAGIRFVRTRKIWNIKVESDAIQVIRAIMEKLLPLHWFKRFKKRRRILTR